MDTALTLTTDMELVLGLVVFTMVMFLFERIRADVVALVVLVVLGLTGLVPREDLFGGFSGSAVMSIIATMILGAGLDRTGALNRLASWLLRRAHGVESRLLLYTTAAAGFTSSIMQNPSVMSLFLPVASRLSSRTGLTLSRMLLPLAAAIVMGGALTMVGNSPLILLNDLLVAANANLPSGAASLEPLNMFAPMPIGIALLAASLAYFHFFGSKLLREDGGDAVTPARTQSYFARAYGIDGDVFELTVTADSPLVGMSLGDAEALHGAPLLLALADRQRVAAVAPGRPRIWVGSVLGAMGKPKQQVTDFAQNNFLRMRRGCATSATCSIPAAPAFPRRWCRRPRLHRQDPGASCACASSTGISLLAINRDKQVLREDVRNTAIRAGDMLVLHSIWRDLAQAAEGKDFVVVTDYPKDEQRPHKFKVAMAIFAASMLLALSSKIPVPIALMTGVAGMLLAGVIHGRGLRGDQLEDRVPDGLPDPAGLGDGQQRRRRVAGRTHAGAVAGRLSVVALQLRSAC
jgi:di/tricarboxylate transporter